MAARQPPKDPHVPRSSGPLLPVPSGPGKPAARRRRHAVRLKRVVVSALPTRAGRFDIYGYESPSGIEHVALVCGGLPRGSRRW